MSDKNTPGAPPPNEETKPKSPVIEKLVFSFHELTFDSAFTIDGDQFIRLFVNNDTESSFFLEMLRDEYLDYFVIYTDLYEEALESESCSCDETVITDFEEVDEIQIIIKGVNPETKEEITIDEKYKVYLVSNVAEHLKVGLHESHILKTIKND